MENQELINPQQAILAALNRAIIGIGKVKKEAKNPRFNSTYATLEQVLDFVNPALHSEGLAMSQSPGYDGASRAVTMVLSFIDPQGNALNYCTSQVPIGMVYPKGQDPQEPNAQNAIAAQTYLARTQIAHVFRLNLTDDDGNEATGWQEDRHAQPAPRQQVRGANDDRTWGPEPDEDLPIGQFRFKGKTFKLAEMSVSALSTVSYTGNYPNNIRLMCKAELKSRAKKGDVDAIESISNNEDV